MYNLRPNQRRAEADAREPSDSESSHKSCSSRSSRRPGSKRATSIMSSISARSQEIIEEQSKEIQRLRAENEKIKKANSESSSEARRKSRFTSHNNLVDKVLGKISQRSDVDTSVQGWVNSGVWNPESSQVGLRSRTKSTTYLSPEKKKSIARQVQSESKLKPKGAHVVSDDLEEGSFEDFARSKMGPTGFDSFIKGPQVESASNVQPGSNFEPVGQSLFHKYIDNNADTQRPKAYAYSNQNELNVDQGPKNTKNSFLAGAQNISTTTWQYGFKRPNIQINDNMNNLSPGFREVTGIGGVVSGVTSSMSQWAIHQPVPVTLNNSMPGVFGVVSDATSSMSQQAIHQSVSTMGNNYMPGVFGVVSDATSSMSQQAIHQSVSTMGNNLMPGVLGVMSAGTVHHTVSYANTYTGAQTIGVQRSVIVSPHIVNMSSAADSGGNQWQYGHTTKAINHPIMHSSQYGATWPQSMAQPVTTAQTSYAAVSTSQMVVNPVVSNAVSRLAQQYLNIPVSMSAAGPPQVIANQGLVQQNLGAVPQSSQVSSQAPVATYMQTSQQTGGGVLQGTAVQRLAQQYLGVASQPMQVSQQMQGPPQVILPQIQAPQQIQPIRLPQPGGMPAPVPALYGGFGPGLGPFNVPPPPYPRPDIPRLKQLPSSIRYDGKTSFDVFAARFVMTLLTQEGRLWTFDEQKYYLSTALTDTAAEYYFSRLQGRHFRDIAEIIEELRNRFGNQETAMIAKIQLRKLSQLETDDDQSWMDRVYQQARNAMPNQPQQWEEEVVNTFILGLRDNEAARYILRNQPHTMAQTLEQLRIYRASQSATQKENKYRAVLRVEGNESARGELKKIQEDIKQLQEVTKNVEEIKRLLIQERGRSRERQRDGSRTRSRSRCFRCGDRGHMVNDCSYEGNVCFGCKKPGHDLKDCDERKSKETGLSQTTVSQSV